MALRGQDRDAGRVQREDLDDGLAAVHRDHLEERIAVAEVKALVLAREQPRAGDALTRDDPAVGAPDLDRRFQFPFPDPEANQLPAVEKPSSPCSSAPASLPGALPLSLGTISML